MRKLLVTVLATALLGAMAVEATGADRRTLRVGDDYFVRSGEPRRVTVDRNTTVVWRWRGDNSHNVTVVDGPVEFGPSDTQSSGSYRKKMRRAGTYRILCTIHSPDMRMTLRVRR